MTWSGWTKSAWRCWRPTRVSRRVTQPCVPTWVRVALLFFGEPRRVVIQTWCHCARCVAAAVKLVPQLGGIATLSKTIAGEILTLGEHGYSENKNPQIIKLIVGLLGCVLCSHCVCVRGATQHGARLCAVFVPVAAAICHSASRNQHGFPCSMQPLIG